MLDSTITKGANQKVKPEEIHEAIKTMPTDKALGVDGSPIEFFTKNWEIVQKDELQTVQQFFQTSIFWPTINTTIITLIPKVPASTKVKDYRPIAFCTTIYKIIAKILTKRLKHVMASLFGNSQPEFIEGRSIINNIIFS